MSSNVAETSPQASNTELRAHQDARAIVRLLQCSQCSYPIREPLTLPCGNSLCRSCIPPLFKRENITYSGPFTDSRSEGFVCPFNDCDLEHPVGDSSIDVTLRKLMEVVKTSINVHKAKLTDTPQKLDEQLNWPNVIDSSMDIMPRSRVLSGGRLVATYVLAEMGELDYYSDVSYSALPDTDPEQIEALDVAVLESLKDGVRAELECQVCYAVMVDPLTTVCGHTFCRRCVARVLDHSNLCPICRRQLPMAPGLKTEPNNKRTSYIVESILPDLMAARAAAIEQEDAIDEDANMPLFPCALAFPTIPTFLHIFEPRYRLMTRRAMENGTQKFGMLMYNQHGLDQGNLGRTLFVQYGTILHIERLELLPDGRSLIEARGTSRFRVIAGSMLDGYAVGQIERIEDISISEEEAIEARETSGSPPVNGDEAAQINHMSTRRLLEHALAFIDRAKAKSARWLHRRVLAAYGDPPTDPATFPYWFASVLPISEEEKYTLLPITSVRERLKITAGWVNRLEAATSQAEERHRVALRAAIRAAAEATRRDAEASSGAAEAVVTDDSQTLQTTENEVTPTDGHSIRPPTSPQPPPAPQSEASPDST